MSRIKGRAFPDRTLPPLDLRKDYLCRSGEISKSRVSALPRAIPGKFVTKDPHGVSSASGRCPLGNTHVPLAFRDETIVEARRVPN
jgi:hypothetical protein